MNTYFPPLNSHFKDKPVNLVSHTVEAFGEECAREVLKFKCGRCVGILTIDLHSDGEENIYSNDYKEDLCWFMEGVYTEEEEVPAHQVAASSIPKLI